MIQNPKSYSGIRWWLKHRKRRYAQNFFMMVLMTFLLVMLVLSAGIQSLGAMEICFMGAFILAALAVTVRMLLKWIHSDRVSITDCTMARVSQKHREHNNARNRKISYLLVEAEGKTQKAFCLPSTYKIAVPGENVLVFSLGGDRRFCVHPDM